MKPNFRVSLEGKYDDNAGYVEHEIQRLVDDKWEQFCWCYTDDSDQISPSIRASLGAGPIRLKYLNEDDEWQYLFVEESK